MPRARDRRDDLGVHLVDGREALRRRNPLCDFREAALRELRVGRRERRRHQVSGRARGGAGLARLAIVWRAKVVADLVRGDQRDQRGAQLARACLGQARRLQRTDRIEVGNADGGVVELAAGHQVREAEALRGDGGAAVAGKLLQQVRCRGRGEGILGALEYECRADVDADADLRREQPVDDIEAREHEIDRRRTPGLEEFVVGNRRHVELPVDDRRSERRELRAERLVQREGGGGLAVGDRAAAGLPRVEQRVGQSVNDRARQRRCQRRIGKGGDFARRFDCVDLAPVGDQATEAEAGAREPHP